MTLKTKTKFHWIIQVFRVIENVLINTFYDDKNKNGKPETFSIGRSTFIIWAYITFLAAVKAIYNNDITVIAGLPVMWWAFGFSCLAYVIGKQYIITNLYGSSTNITHIKVDDDEKDGPH